MMYGGGLSVLAFMLEPCHTAGWKIIFMKMMPGHKESKRDEISFVWVLSATISLREFFRMHNGGGSERSLFPSGGRAKRRAIVNRQRSVLDGQSRKDSHYTRSGWCLMRMGWKSYDRIETAPRSIWGIERVFLCNISNNYESCVRVLLAIRDLMQAPRLGLEWRYKVDALDVFRWAGMPYCCCSRAPSYDRDTQQCMRVG